MFVSHSQLAGMFPLALETAIVKPLKDKQPGLAFFYTSVILLERALTETKAQQDFTCGLLGVKVQMTFVLLKAFGLNVYL